MEKAKNYIEQLKKKGFSIETVKDIVKDFGFNGAVLVQGDYNWNHQIDGFSLYEGELMISIYWQGDSVDGNTSVEANKFRTRSTVTIPAETFFDGYRTRTTHSDLHITREELESTVGPLIEWLSPENIQTREQQKRQEEAYIKVKTYTQKNLVPEFRDYDYYKYGKKALVINQYIYENAIELAGMTHEQLEEKMWAVFKEK